MLLLLQKISPPSEKLSGVILSAPIIWGLNQNLNLIYSFSFKVIFFLNLFLFLYLDFLILLLNIFCFLFFYFFFSGKFLFYQKHVSFLEFKGNAFLLLIKFFAVIAIIEITRSCVIFSHS